MTKREFLDIVFALAPNEANAIMDAFDEYVDSNRMSIEQEKMIVESLPSLYPLQEFEEKAIDTVLNAIPHWIPVTERLPEVKQRVIVQYADGSMAIKRCIDAGHLQWFYTKMGIVAWMPLPEPYKGVTE